MRLISCVLFLLATAAAAGCVSGSGNSDGGSDADTDTDIDTDTDSDGGTDTETDDGCTASGNWYDPLTDLCWENPPQGAGETWDDSYSYCDNLSLGGHDDWRLPMIQELVSLLRGCVDGTIAEDNSLSTCGVTDPDCLGALCDDEGCQSCDPNQGPDDSPLGCYWNPALEGECETSSKYWSSSPNTSNETTAWVVYYSLGGPSYSGKSGINLVRCVHGEP